MNENQGKEQTDISLLYSSTFAQVIFVNVEKVYMTDVPVKCNYTLTPRIVAHKKDWIGIFKVGWSTARDYHTFVWAPLPKEDNQVERQQQVMFEAYYLPKDYNDFYQFCYVTQKGEIRGASTPFGFKPAHSSLSDHLDNDFSQEMLIITTQDKLEETEREKDDLKASNVKLMEENTALKEKIKEFETQAQQDKEEQFRALEMNKTDMMALEKQMLEQKVDNEVELKAQTEKTEQLRRELAEKDIMCLKVQKENQELRAKMESAQVTVEQLKQNNDKAADKARRLQQEAKSLRMEINTKETELTNLAETKNQIAKELEVSQENIKHLQSELDNQKKENGKLADGLKKMAGKEIEVQKQTAEVLRLQQALSDCEKLKAASLTTERQLQEQVENLQQCLRIVEEQLQLAEKQQVQMTAELKAVKADGEKSDANLRDAREDVQHWKSKFEKLDQIFSKNEVKFKEMERELDNKTHIVDLRTMEVADLQEEIKKLNRKIDNLRVSSNHQNGTFQLEHPNPYSLTVPKVHSGHSGLLFGNPYSECGANESQTGGSLDAVQTMDGTETSAREEAIPTDCQKCPVCEVLFPLYMEDFDFEQHVQKHFMFSCPVCQKHFSDNQQRAYEDHVQSHFLDTM
ncbi:calcium-binding and coiled-coil domain-containing protein 2-like isoform X1 [Stegostoma tigrinum]|uniref:calcium-binding and coiled-coil domain-containing protein 2-like isoform X1 n=1 Tax=Stegostoma tigrinum TaxID=3053191 RepID=UPI00202B24DB|nr:calcium-binding and coiled-coil domain-containing protein 2-like isoform X1 [Stegostoma tigrinum]